MSTAPAMSIDEIRALGPDAARALAIKRVDEMEAAGHPRAKEIRALLDKKPAEPAAASTPSLPPKARVFSIPSSTASPSSQAHVAKAADIAGLHGALEASHNQLRAHVVELTRKNQALEAQISEVRVAMNAMANDHKMRHERTHALLRRFAHDSGVQLNDGE